VEVLPKENWRTPEDVRLASPLIYRVKAALMNSASKVATSPLASVSTPEHAF